MEKELIALKKKLYDLDDIGGDVWVYIHNWAKKFWLFIGKNGSKYGWCEKEFENIKDQYLERKNMKDSFRVFINIYKELFEKIESKE